jgi:hypothetical protein
MASSNYRRIWEAAYGPVPEGMTIDHIDGNRHNNSLSNLRLANRFGQAQNRGTFKSNTSGYKGVRQIGVKFEARVTAFKVIHYLGMFDTAEEASAVREAKARELHGEFYREVG